jgi:hypothetical protein
MADYHSIIAKAVPALDLNTEKAQRRLYERARPALRSKCIAHTRRFISPKLRPAEMSLEMAIEAVEAEAVREQNVRLATLATSRLRAGASITQACRRTKMAKCVILSRHSGLVSSVEPTTEPQVAAKRCPTRARTAPLAGDALG